MGEEHQHQCHLKYLQQEGVCREAGPRQGRQGEQERGRAWQVK